MTAEIFLARKYIFAHMKQWVGVTIACALFVAAFVTTLICRESFQATVTEDHDRLFGLQSGVIYRAESTDVEKYQAELESSGSGMVRAVWRVESNNNIVFVGSMDASARQLRKLALKEGRYAERSGEIAIEEATLVAMFPGVECGNMLDIDVIKDDTVVTETYLLVGVIEDYIDNWEKTDASKISIEYPPPALLVVDDGSPEEYIHILCGNDSIQETINGEYSINGHDRLDPALVSKMNRINIVTFTIILFFAVVMVFGIISNISYMMKAQARYLTMLRCIGLKRHRGVLLFMLQAVVLAISSSLLGLLFSLVLSWLIVPISALFGLQLVYSTSLLCFGPALLIACIVILGVFLYSVLHFFKQMPLETGKETNVLPNCAASEVHNIKKLWLHATARKNRAQNTVAIILIAACLFITVFGGFVASFMPWESYGTIESNDKDYVLYVSGGIQEAENFFISVPRPQGVSWDDFLLLRETEGIEIRTAVIDRMTSHFVLYSPESNVPYFDQLLNEERVLRGKNISYLADLIVKLGGDEGDYLVEPRLTGVDYDSVVKSINLIEGDIVRDSFVAGDTIIAPNTFDVGDSFLLVTPLIANEVLEQNNPKRFDFITKQVTVSAVYDSAQDSRLFYSAEAIMKFDNTARFEQIELVNVGRNDTNATSRIENLLNQIVAHSPRTSMINCNDQRQQYVQAVRNGQALTALCVLIFTVLVVISISYSMKVKLHMNLHSYMLMRAIGANGRLIKELVCLDIVRIITIGSLIGFSTGMLIPVVLVKCFYGKLLIVRFLVWPASAAIIVVAMLLVLGLGVVQKPINQILKDNIASALGAVEL